MSFLSDRILFVRYLFIIPLAVIGLFATTTDSFAQQTNVKDTSSTSYWVHGGTSIHNLGMGIHGGFSVDYNQHVFSLRTVSTDLSYGAETWDVALLYGRSTTFRSWYLSAGVGAAITGGTKYPGLFGSGKGTPMETMMGFPLEANLSWQPTGFVALGIYSFANVNTEHPFGGMGLTVRVGNL
jgi:hypothetical protein